ncbi:sulfite exporter TauE/SafE family protein [Pelagicoccus albus]|uniref:Probable membrane transporter protein n=1 Tax=Pelagicoccus albus TaxID=415222 RepID=A0A7X1B931_9BACT|nr:sulfite exporter TauE/SafE family protein [Pelagicoccus albus]MBC2607947.1 sulfite exporter TauE/SafE family protein [Pelagicoccus albus]
MTIDWPTFLYLAIILFIAGFSHGVTGFGVGIVAISLLTLFLPIYYAAAFAALTALLTGLVILFVYRNSFTLRPVLKLLAGAIPGIPVGMHFVRKLDSQVALSLLGVVIIGFSLFSLSRPHLPKIKYPWVAYLFGFGSGTLAGAFNAGGPFAIIYGLCSGWNEKEFKSNITGYMMINMTALIVMHGANGNLPLPHLKLFALASPILILSVLLGLKSAHLLNPQTLKRIVLCFLLLIGVKYSISIV